MGRHLTTGLTSAHRRILAALGRLSVDRGFSPISELVEDLHLAGDTSINATLKIMERNGFICIHGGGKRGRRRTVCLTTQGKQSLGLGGLPVFGHIPAGPLSEVLQQSDTVIESAELLPHQVGDFLLIVQGDSMIGAGILPNDKVLLRPHVAVREKEIAAVHIGDEYVASLKHVCFGRGQGQITLKANNPKYKDIIVSAEDVKIAGVFRGLIRLS
jgi:repressor LexA